MALPPGLLPETSEARTSRLPLVLGGILLAALVALGATLVENRQLRADRDAAVEELAAARRRPAAPPAPELAPPPPVAAPAPAPVPAEPAEAPVSAPRPRSADLAIAPREEPPYIPRGLQDFRAGRYDQAERQFFRALPESLLYLSLTSLAQRNWREAFTFLSRAMVADPGWLRRVNPRDLFGNPADYDALLQALNDQGSKTPTDPDLKTLAAYIQYHEKGAPYAKALLIEATNLNPDHEAARTFLEALGP